jgi:hypothetical protein
MIKGSLVPGLSKEEIYKEFIYYANKTMCEYSSFSEKKMETLKVLSRLKKKKKKEKKIF